MSDFQQPFVDRVYDKSNAWRGKKIVHPRTTNFRYKQSLYNRAYIYALDSRNKNIRKTLSCSGDTKNSTWGAWVGQGKIEGPTFYK